MIGLLWAESLVVYLLCSIWLGILRSSSLCISQVNSLPKPWRLSYYSHHIMDGRFEEVVPGTFALISFLVSFGTVIRRNGNKIDSTIITVGC